MLETGSGRPRTSRSPRCPGFTLPGDTSGRAGTTRDDITEPFVLDDGTSRCHRPAAGSA
jgi:O-succinylbenzoate synthase